MKLKRDCGQKVDFPRCDEENSQKNIYFGERGITNTWFDVLYYTEPNGPIVRRE